MKDVQSKNISWKTALIIVLALGSLGLAYLHFKISEDLKETKIELSNTKADLESSMEQSAKLAADLDTEKYKNSLFGGQISELATTIGRLDTLSKTDKELLQKYSKIYFLNENYVPDSLVDLPKEFPNDESKTLQMHTKVLPFIKSMFNDAKKDGVNLKVISAYRSFGEQASLKEGYLFSYGSGANRFSADQGYSEHQLGTAVDLTNDKLANNYTDFGETQSFEWMQKNAYKYGFILSYPEGNTYYQYEPWHWRFVGRKLAERLHEENQNFYDLSQSQIDPYLISIWD